MSRQALVLAAMLAAAPASAGQKTAVPEVVLPPTAPLAAGAASPISIPMAPAAAVTAGAPVAAPAAISAAPAASAVELRSPAAAVEGPRPAGLTTQGAEIFDRAARRPELSETRVNVPMKTKRLARALVAQKHRALETSTTPTSDARRYDNQLLQLTTRYPGLAKIIADAERETQGRIDEKNRREKRSALILFAWMTLVPAVLGALVLLLHHL
jgi:hypothetical protein